MVKYYDCYDELLGISKAEHDYLYGLLQDSGRFNRGPKGQRSIEDKLVMWLSKYAAGSSSIRVSGVRRRLMHWHWLTRCSGRQARRCPLSPQCVRGASNHHRDAEGGAAGLHAGLL